MNNIFSLITNDEDKRLTIGNIEISADDINIGNAYNSSAIIEVSSGFFCGRSEFEFDLKCFKVFVTELGIMYKTLLGKAVLKDLSYGSYVSFEMDRKGILHVNGLLEDIAKMQALKFSFDTDQTSLKELSVKLNQWLLDK